MAKKKDLLALGILVAGPGFEPVRVILAMTTKCYLYNKSGVCKNAKPVKYRQWLALIKAKSNHSLKMSPPQLSLHHR